MQHTQRITIFEFYFRVVKSVTISHKNEVRFVLTYSCLYEGSCLDYLCLLAYCVVLLCFFFDYVGSFS